MGLAFGWLALFIDPVAVVSGFAVGAIVGMTGVGGGSLMTPLWLGVFRLSPTLAIGTDLWFAAVTKSGGGWAHHRLGHVDRRGTGLLLAGSRPATVGTLVAMHLGGGVTGGRASAVTRSLARAHGARAAVRVAGRRRAQRAGLRR